MPPLSKISLGTASSIGLAVVAASLVLPAKIQAGAFTAALIPMATVAEVDRSANPLDLPDNSQPHEIASADASNSAGAAGGFRGAASQQRMLISGHDGSASGGDTAGALSLRRRAIQSGSGMGAGGGSGGSGTSGASPPLTSSGPIVTNHNGPTSGPPVFHTPPVTPGDVSNPPPQQGGDSQFVPSGINNPDIVGQDPNSPSNFPDTTTANATESPLSFPEPGSMTLLSVGVGGLFVWRRRCKIRLS